jgi:hypothetical protein
MPLLAHPAGGVPACGRLGACHVCCLYVAVACYDLYTSCNQRVYPLPLRGCCRTPSQGRDTRQLCRIPGGFIG